MALITDSQLISHLDSFIAGHLQNPGNSAIDDFHAELRRRAVAQFFNVGAGATGVTGIVAVGCAFVATAVTGVAAAIAAPIGTVIHLHYQSAVEQNIDQMKTMWRTWYSSYWSSYRTTALREADQFARDRRRRDPSQMDTDHYPALEQGFLEYAGAPCQAYIYVSVWNHIAYHWDRACAQQARRSPNMIQGSALEGPNGVLMPCRTLGPRNAYGAPLPSATDAEAHRPAHTAMPSEDRRWEMRSL